MSSPCASPAGRRPSQLPCAGPRARAAGPAAPRPCQAPAARPAAPGPAGEGAPGSRPDRRFSHESWRRLPSGGGPPERPRLSPSIRAGLGRVARRSDTEDGGEGLRPPRPGAPLGLGGARRAAALGQGAPPAAVALGADLAGGGGVVLILVGQLVDLVRQLLHRARPEAAPRADGLEVGEAVNALAVALDADVSILPAAARQEERERA